MSSATDQLRELRDRERVERERVARLETEQRAARRRIDAARAPLDAYYEGLGAGEQEPDPELEQRLAAGVREAEGSIATRPTSRRGVGLVELEQYDPRIEGELRGAHRVLQAATAEAERFVVANRAQLVAELLPAAEQAAERLLAAADELGKAWQEWARVASDYVNRLGVPPDDVPPDPFGETGQALNQRLANIDRYAREDPRRLVPAPTWASEARE